MTSLTRVFQRRPLDRVAAQHYAAVPPKQPLHIPVHAQKDQPADPAPKNADRASLWTAVPLWITPRSRLKCLERSDQGRF